MKKTLLLIVIILHNICLWSQVGINTTDVKGQLHINNTSIATTSSIKANLPDNSLLTLFNSTGTLNEKVVLDNEGNFYKIKNAGPSASVSNGEVTAINTTYKKITNIGLLNEVTMTTNNTLGNSNFFFFKFFAISRSITGYNLINVMYYTSDTSAVTVGAYDTTNNTLTINFTTGTDLILHIVLPTATSDGYLEARTTNAASNTTISYDILTRRQF